MTRKHRSHGAHGTRTPHRLLRVVRGQDGRTPLDLAGKEEVKAVLREHGA